MDSGRSAPRPGEPDEGLFASFARTSPPAPAGGAGPCPDPGLLAGLAEGRLVAAERDAVEAHLARCEDCRGAVAAWVLDPVAAAPAAPLPAPARPRGRLLRRAAWFAIPAAAAAALLVAFSLQGRPDRGTGPLDDATLVAAAKGLAAARPDLFREFRPLDRGERLAMPLAPKRGGALGLRAPCGKLLDPRPAFRWEAVPGVARWRVTLLTADGKRLWTAESTEPTLAYSAGESPLRPGTRYLYEVAGEGPLGPERARRAFDVASERESTAASEARKAIAEGASRGAAPLLEAHWLLRAGLAAEAEAPARRALQADPASPLARETLHLVLETLGDFDAADALLRDAGGVK